jgi:hypothetical protein
MLVAGAEKSWVARCSGMSKEEVSWGASTTRRMSRARIAVYLLCGEVDLAK